MCQTLKQRWFNVKMLKLTLNQRSCIKSYEHSCLKLFLNGPEAVFKQQNRRSNHEIYVLPRDPANVNA